MLYKKKRGKIKLSANPWNRPGDPARHLPLIRLVGRSKPASQVRFLPIPHKPMNQEHARRQVGDQRPRARQGRFPAQDQERPEHHRVAHEAIGPAGHESRRRIERQRSPAAFDVKEVHAPRRQGEAVGDEPRPHPLPRISPPGQRLMGRAA